MNDNSSKKNLKLHGLLGEFKDIESILEASRAIRDRGFKKWDTHTPYPVHGMDPAMGIKKSLVPKIVFVCGVIGGLGGLGLQLWTNSIDYPWNVSGKPLFSVPANIPIVFETTVLLAAFGAVFGMIFLNNLPRLHNPLFTSKNFVQGATTDKLFVYIEAEDTKFSPDRTRELLESLGAVNIEAIEDEVETWMPTLSPKMAWSLGSILFCLVLIPPLYIARAQAKDKTTPRVQLIPDMDQQPRVNSQSASPIFLDGRGMRNYVDGTVPRGGAQTDSAFYTGAVNEQWVENPRKVDMALLERGRERYDIFCASCHGYDGSGNGPTHLRAQKLREPNWVPPLAMTDQTVLDRPDGHIFNTITNGIRNMSAYADQIPPDDRWAIVAYVRALQKSQHATLEDVPADQREQFRQEEQQ